MPRVKESDAKRRAHMLKARASSTKVKEVKQEDEVKAEEGLDVVAAVSKQEQLQKLQETVGELTQQQQQMAAVVESLQQQMQQANQQQQHTAQFVSALQQKAIQFYHQQHQTAQKIVALQREVQDLQQQLDRTKQQNAALQHQVQKYEQYEKAIQVSKEERMQQLVEHCKNGERNAIFASKYHPVTLMYMVVMFIIEWFTTTTTYISDKFKANMEGTVAIKPVTQMKLFNSFCQVLGGVRDKATLQSLIDAYNDYVCERKQQIEYNKLARERVVKEWIEKKIEEYSGFLSCRMLSRLAKQEKLQYTSQSFFCRVLRKYFRHTSIGFKPALTDQHVIKRLSFVQQILRVILPQRVELEYYTDPRTMMIHCDEKWFSALSHSMKVYVPKGQRAPRFNIPSKSFIPKVMFFAAVGRPIFDEKGNVVFDGRVVFRPVKELTQYKRPRKNSPPMKTEYCSVTKLRFIQYMQETVTSAVEKYNPAYMDRIVIQVDNAGGHGGGRGNMDETVFKTLYEWLDSQRENNPKFRVPIFFLAQPGRSPDLNVLDLGAWYSLQYAVSAVFYKHCSNPEDKTWESQVEKKCIETWNKWNTPEVLTKLFETLKNVHLKILQSGGENHFNVPHKREMKDIHLEDFLPQNQVGGDPVEQHADSHEAPVVDRPCTPRATADTQADTESSGSPVTPQRRPERRRPATCPRTRSRSINRTTGSRTATPPARRRRTSAATPTSTTSTSQPCVDCGDQEPQEMTIETPQGPMRIVLEGNAYVVHQNGDRVQVDKETWERIHEEDLGE